MGAEKEKKEGEEDERQVTLLHFWKGGLRASGHGEVGANRRYK